ncbi:hypothetical protein ABT288_48015 [Streptomyces sp. NPDC001093]|uniref:hypothetical protein n=1 Tax=Streptomyces sp. NPDC001093 TaxID=3154376 RepID=UPI00331D826A
MEKHKSDQRADDGSWVPSWLKDTVYTIGDYGQAILSNPDIWAGLIQTGADIWGTGQGGEVVFGGAELCLSGFGCLVGAPAIAGGIVIAGAGIYEITDGISRFNNGLGQALREAEERRPVEGTCTQCFVAGTKVHMAGASTENIENIRAGDKVVATNALTGKTAPHKVTRLIVTDGDRDWQQPVCGLTARRCVPIPTGT